MSESDTLTAARSTSVSKGSQKHRWISTAGAWLGIGTSPGALLLGAGIAERYGGPIPLLSLAFSLFAMFMILWFQGVIGLPPPIGEGKNLTAIAPLYIGPTMQRILGAVIAMGMIGWFGFNIGLGAAALGALVSIPQWAASLLLGLPILGLALMGIRSWNWLAGLTTISVLVLVAIVVVRLAARSTPITLQSGSPSNTVADVAVFVGYISVFSLRTPDFTYRLGNRKDLFTSILLLTSPLLVIALAGVSLQQGTGSADLISILASPGGLAIGNLLITTSVIAPTFTTFYSGAPGLRAAVGLAEKPAMIAIGMIGLILALARFDLWLLSWLSVLGATLPPLVVPLAVEGTRRRLSYPPRIVPIWVWLPGSLIAVALTLLQQPLAPLVGLITAAVLSGAWLFINKLG
ncbi:MAG: hypothetical protein PVG14_11665 [Anaerolineales bacterium]|jgi:hypothetical protein